MKTIMIIIVLIFSGCAGTTKPMPMEETVTYNDKSFTVWTLPNSEWYIVHTIDSDSVLVENKFLKREWNRNEVIGFIVAEVL